MPSKDKKVDASSASCSVEKTSKPKKFLNRVRDKKSSKKKDEPWTYMSMIMVLIIIIVVIAVAYMIYIYVYCATEEETVESKDAIVAEKGDIFDSIRNPTATFGTDYETASSYSDDY